MAITTKPTTKTVRPKGDGKCDICGDSEIVRYKTTGVLKGHYACVNCREMAVGYR